MSGPGDPLETLLAEYRERLPRRRRALAALWRRLPGDEESGGVCAELRLQVHRLAGSAGAFGFSRLSAAAREVDQLLKAWLFSPAAQRPPRREWIASLEAPFAAMLAAFGEAVAEGGEADPRPSDATFQLIHVEDDVEQAAILGAHLRRLGMVTALVADGERLFERLAERRPDAVLLDYWLAGETGADLARAIRATPALHNLPILCLTSDLSDRIRLDALAAGCDEVMSKVQSAAQLAAAICAWVESVLPPG